MSSGPHNPGSPARLERFGVALARLFERILPDPIVLAVGLTIVVILWAAIWPATAKLNAMDVTSRGAAILRIWFAGLWDAGFLTFALQMCLVLLTGHALATSPIVAAGLDRLTGSVTTPRGAAALVATVSCIGCWINWGFGLVAAGVLAAGVITRWKERAETHFAAVVVAAAYSGMMIWHGGLSGSAPLKVAGSGVMVGSADLSPVAIPVSQTILSPANLVLSAVMMVAIPWLMSRFVAARNDGQRAGIAADRPNPTENQRIPSVDIDHKQFKLSCDAGPGVAGVLNRSRFLSILLALMGFGALALRIGAAGVAAIDLNFVITLFLSAGLLLHRSLVAYIAAASAGGPAIVGIVIQFPLYAGIQGLMRDTGLSALVSQWFIDMSNFMAQSNGVSQHTTFPVAAFFSAGIVNFFVPSGGGQWIVQGPIMCSAAHEMGIPLESAVMAISYGDQWTNMVQPFWAIPLMGLTGVNPRQFMGYCALLMLLAAPVFALALIL